MSGAGFNGNEALGSRVLMDIEALGELESASDFERLFCDCILNTYVQSGLQWD